MLPPYLKKYGLLIVELHSIPTAIASKNIGTSLSTPYDATHGYTDQYIIELECFLNAAKHAGLQPITKYTSNYPDKEKATVSIHLLKANWATYYGTIFALKLALKTRTPYKWKDYLLLFSQFRFPYFQKHNVIYQPATLVTQAPIWP